jgi:hypothetical protein
MTPKEKAQELYNHFAAVLSATTAKHRIKKCALIAVDEILKSFGTLTNGNMFYTTYNAPQFYKKVRREIEQL